MVIHLHPNDRIELFKFVYRKLATPRMTFVNLPISQMSARHIILMLTNRYFSTRRQDSFFKTLSLSQVFISVSFWCYILAYSLFPIKDTRYHNSSFFLPYSESKYCSESTRIFQIRLKKRGRE